MGFLWYNAPPARVFMGDTGSLALGGMLGTIAVAYPSAIQTKHMCVDVETRGELTRGMTVFDQRHWLRAPANVEVATDVDGKAVRDYITRVLKLDE